MDNPAPSGSTHSSDDGSGRKSSLLSIIGPGILVAATGVGAGDLAGGALAAANLKLACLWVPVVGVILKYTLCEGLARWQLITGTSLADGVFRRTGTAGRWIFTVFLIYWSFCIGGMLITACASCAWAIVPIGNPDVMRPLLGVVHSFAAVALLRAGGFRLFERVMSVCVGVMFVTVMTVAVWCRPDFGALIRGLLIPTVPKASGDGFLWTITLLAGVGGTVTMLCYGNWIREKGRTTPAALPICRIDLGVGHLLTALFGMAMVVLGARLPVDTGTRGAALVSRMADDMQVQLGTIGPVAAWMFRVGAWGAVFSSVLGVWQCIPELFADVVPVRAGAAEAVQVLRRRRTAAAARLMLATLPLIALLRSPATAQKIAGIAGTLFIIIFAVSLLILGRSASRSTDPAERNFSNGPLTVLVLTVCVVVFVVFLAITMKNLFT